MYCPKISIVIPVHNAEDYLENCLNSVMNQNYKNLEIICINDASEDNSLQIINEYTKIDNRICIINEKVNVGTSKARKDGVLYSTGQYILFIDADDELLPNACNKLMTICKDTKYDIVQFDIDVIRCNDISEASVWAVKKYVRPLYGEHSIYEVRKKCFSKGALAHNLCGKIYSGDVCRRAFSYMQDDKLLMAEDLYAYFLITFFSRSYLGIEDVFYQYNYGIGITGENRGFYTSLEAYCSQSIIIERCYAFIKTMGEENTFSEILESIRKNLIHSFVMFLSKHQNAFSEIDTSKMEEIFCKYWSYSDMAYICTELTKMCQGREKTIEEKVWKFPFHKVKNGADIILYGAGDVGKDYCEQICSSNFCNIKAWVDRDYKRYYTRDEKILSPDIIKQISVDYIVIAIRDKRIGEEIIQNIINMGVNKSKIIWEI